MHSSTLLAVALATIGAQADPSTVIGFFHPVMDSVDLPNEGVGATSVRASVVDVKASVATYQVNCEDGTPESICHFAKPATIIQGPNTNSHSIEWIATGTGPVFDVTVTETWDCSLAASTGSASCDISYAWSGTRSGSASSSTSTGTTTYASAPFGGDNWSNLTVTAGLESYTKPAATETGGAVAGPAGPMITAGPILAAAVAALL